MLLLRKINLNVFKPAVILPLLIVLSSISHQGSPFFFFFFFTEKHNSDTKEPPFIIHLNQSKLSGFFAEITVRAQLYCQT